MDILVLSDSHGRVGRIQEVLLRQIKKPDAVIFLGDGLKDIDNVDIGDIPVYKVSGNCDNGIFYSFNDAPDEQCLIIGDKRIFFTHGHRYGVKSTIVPLMSEGAKRASDIILFGHTHDPFAMALMPENDYGIKTDKPIHILNPGSIGQYPYCFGVITIDRGGAVLLSHGSLI